MTKVESISALLCCCVCAVLNVFSVYRCFIFLFCVWLICCPKCCILLAKPLFFIQQTQFSDIYSGYFADLLTFS